VSPYADTHEVLEGEIIIYKIPGESFGVSFKYESQSALVDPDTADNLNDQVTIDKKSASLAKNEVSVTAHSSSGTGNENAVPSNEYAKKRSPVDSTAAGNQTVLKAQDNIMATHASHAILAQQPVEQRRPRRRRVFFGVLTVVTAEKQNAQFEAEDSSRQLKAGDVVLKVNGHKVGGLTFQQAITLFASCDSAAAAPASDGGKPLLIRCPLEVARRKQQSVVPWTPTVSVGIPGASHGLSVAQSKVPFVVNTLTDRIVSGDFTNAEVLAVAQAGIRCLSAKVRPLGYGVPSNLELAHLQGPGLNLRDFSSVKEKQNHAIRSFEQSMKELAMAHWARQWKLEQENVGGTDLQVSNLSDAERSALRELPRPLKGCRCGSTDHEYVNDNKCILYRNLRALSEKKAEPEEERKGGKKLKADNLNAVETAYKERILKLKETTEREEAEARFVQEMEELQVKKLKMAVFAPSLTAMVLSSVAELSKHLSDTESTVEDAGDVVAVDKSDKQPSSSVTTSTTERVPTTEEAVPSPKESLKVDDNAVDDDDEDDDDIPLMALSKRSGPSHQEPDPKRTKINSTSEAFREKDGVKERPSLDLSFMAKVLRHISHTWGHLYTEPSDSDYSWRWEVYHGQTSSGESYRESKSRNPRQIESLSFENIRFALSDDVLARLSAAGLQNETSYASDASLAVSNDILLMSHLLSPKRTGVYDEIMALMKMGVLRRTRGGCVVLAEDWEVHVDPLVLSEMEQHWCKRMDPMNKFGLCRSMRAKLERSWVRIEAGWALSADPDDIIFGDGEWDEWRTHFRHRFESQINESEGIEKFGI